MRKFIIGCFVYIFFLGCQEKADTVVECKYEIKVDLERVKDSILFSDLFEKVSYVRIPTDDNFLIGRIDKLVVSDDYIFMLNNNPKLPIYKSFIINVLYLICDLNYNFRTCNLHTN